jgi:hypothetical protein
VCVQMLTKAQGPLAIGKLSKVAVPANGIYKITGSTLIKMGANLNQLNAQNIKILGNSGAMLPQTIGNETPGLQNISFKILGLEDGHFDPADEIWFYGMGPLTKFYNQASGRFYHQLNLYDKQNYYFIALNAGTGNMILKEPTKSNIPQVFKNFDDYLVHEVEKTNVLKTSGRHWVGEDINSNGASIEVDFGINDAQTQGAILQGQIMARSIDVHTKYNIVQAGNVLFGQTIPGIRDYKYAPKANISTFAENLTLANSTAKFNIVIENKELGYKQLNLDYLCLQVKRPLVYNSKILFFQNLASLNNTANAYQIANATNTTQIWDITAIEQVKELEAKNGLFTSQTNGQLGHFVAFEPKDIVEIKEFATVPTQNVLDQPAAELLIIAPNAFAPAAQQLAIHRQTHDGLKATVVALESIYNELSGGKTDPTAIRNFAHYQYKKHAALKYLLLLADATFDFRNIDNGLSKIQLANTIPAYQSVDSVDPLRSYSSEDYYGFMQLGEGEWAENDNNNDNHSLDIGVGRLPVNSLQQAYDVVQKLIDYDLDTKNMGQWRSKISLSSDDGDGNLHQSDTEDLDRQVALRKELFSTQKIYIDSHPRLTGEPFGRLSPECNITVKEAFSKGSLIFNYIGHGGVENLSDEKILLREELASWQNKHSLPVMMTATCEFGRYDDPGDKSGAELALLNPNGGAIALLTTTRPVSASSNKVINEAFFRVLLKEQNIKNLRLGDMVRQTKNSSQQYVYNRNFTLLGDPSMQLAYPKHSIEVTGINGKKPTTSDTLRAFEKIIITGRIKSAENQTIIQNFSGNIYYKLFDKLSTQKTLGNNNNQPMAYKIFDQLIAQGQTLVTNGTFTITLLMPKGIRYQYGQGKLELYAKDENNALDAAYNYSPIVGGQAKANTSDQLGPEIKMQLLGSKQQPRLYASITDDSGINLNPADLGHELSLSINNNETVILNSFFESANNTKPSGYIDYIISQLPAGTHTIQLSVWDIYHNKSTATATLTIAEQSTQTLTGLIASPNPVADQLSLQMDNNSAGQKELNIAFYEQTGKKLLDFTSLIYENGPMLKYQIPASIIASLPRGWAPLIVKVQLKSPSENFVKSGSYKIMLSR